jgi:hypothetical protein
MLKWQKKQAFEMLNVLDEAHNEIRVLSDSGNKSAVVGLLSEAQDCVSSLCEFLRLQTLDEAAGAYYNELYETSLLETDAISQAIGRLDSCLSGITSVIDTEPLKKETVFFPYKADMWDSFESIWIAAKEDENCETFVVPIPYYSTEEIGKYMTLHCDAAGFPPYVPVLDWETYNLEERKPDVAYIHNPYDDHNYVTKIHERFCSSNLKKFVELLVYSPYSVVYKSIGHTQSVPAANGRRHLRVLKWPSRFPLYP